MPGPRGLSPEGLVEARQAVEVLGDRPRDDQVRRDVPVAGRQVQLSVDRLREADRGGDPSLTGHPGPTHGATLTRGCDEIVDTRAQERALRRPARGLDNLQLMGCRFCGW